VIWIHALDQFSKIDKSCFAAQSKSQPKPTSMLFDKIEAQLRQSLKTSDSATPTADAQVAASLLVAFMQGRLQRFARTGFKRLPSEHLQAALARML
jgi:hypothetical protein